MLTRRDFLLSGLVSAAFRNDTLSMVESTLARFGERIDAEDEDFWAQIQQAFQLDRNVVNFNNGGCSPSPRIVQQMLERQLELSNQAPSYYMWRELEPEIESVRSRLAATFGVDAEEIAITRNASESLENLIFGFDLKEGDEVISSNLDYPRMVSAIQQRERRDGVKMVRVLFPAVPNSLEELSDRVAAAVTNRTRMIHMPHVSFQNGQIFPVAKIAEIGRAHGIPTIIDGAHAFAQFPFKQKDLQCEMYGVSLHKWLMAPIGTGMLYVRKGRIPDIWSLMASGSDQVGNIRKFEEIGTHPAANHNAIGEALTFHEMIGVERKAARFRYLRDRWTRRIAGHPKVRWQTNLHPEHSCAITTVGIDGISQGDLAAWLLTKHHILVTTIGTDAVNGIRVTPNVYSTVQEVDRFAAAMEVALDKGIKD